MAFPFCLVVLVLYQVLPRFSMDPAAILYCLVRVS